MRVTLLVIFVAAASTGCKVDLPDFVTGGDGGPDAVVDPCPTSYSVGGTVDGLWTPAAVALSLDPGGTPELLTVQANGAFTFQTCLQDQTSFVVSVGTQPTQHTCTVFNGNGTIHETDATNVTVRCEGPVAVDVTLSLPVTFDFDPISTRQVLQLSLVSQAVMVTVQAPTAEAILIGGVATPSGIESAPTTLMPGTNVVRVDVTAGIYSRAFELELDRGAFATAPLTMFKAQERDTNDQYSKSLDVVGDTMAIGTPEEDSNRTGWLGANIPPDEAAPSSGIVYLYRKMASHYGPYWGYEGFVKASNTDAGDRFGKSLALGDGFVAIGAPGEASGATGINGNESDNTAPGAGAVYVFRRDGSTWVKEAYLKASNAQAGDGFGFSVAVSGDLLVVGAVGEASAATGVNGDQSDNSLTEAGAAYLFRRSGQSWSQEAYLKASDTTAAQPTVGDNFGFRVAASGDAVAVSGYREDSAATGVNGDALDNSADESGAVWVFRRTANIWSPEAYVKASNTGANDFFGWSLALDHDTLVVGACYEGSFATGVDGVQSDNSAPASGAAYVFHHGTSAWVQEAYLKASNTDSGDTFGWSIDVQGDLVLVGSPAEASAAQNVDGNQASEASPGSGAAYLFHRTDVGWTQVSYLKSSNTGIDDIFGDPVSLSGDTLLVGAQAEDSAVVPTDNDLTDSGAAYTFR